jgi:hypothetical protein
MMNKILELVVFSQDLLVTLANVPKLSRKHLWHVLYKECSFHSDPLTDMAAKGNSCF